MVYVSTLSKNYFKKVDLYAEVQWWQSLRIKIKKHQYEIC